MIDRYTLPKMQEIWSEENKFRKWLEVEVAACEGWNKLGKIPDDSLRKIKRNAKFSVKRIKTIEKTVDHDIIAFLTSVAENVGQDSRYIHMGLTSNDIVDTANSLMLEDASQVIQGDISDMVKSLKKRAKANKDTVMIGRTHGVHAEPMTFGLKMAVYMKEMERNLERFKAAREGMRVGKLSGAVGTYSNIDPKVEEVALKSLRLNRVDVANQVIQRDRHAEYMMTLAIIAATLEKIALEIRGLQRTEVGEAEEPFKKGQKGSSAMPHKKNPITCERICGLARVVRANAMVSLENIALWHERDISHSSTERIILPDSTILVDYMLQTMTRIIDNLVVYKENMKRNLEKSGGLIFSQRLLIALVDKKLTREEAYKIVQSNAMRARGLGRSFKDVTLADPKIKKHLDQNEIKSAFDIKYYLRNVDMIYKRLGL
jgi:adenylosuccinate lyase